MAYKNAKRFPAAAKGEKRVLPIYRQRAARRRIMLVEKYNCSRERFYIYTPERRGARTVAARADNAASERNNAPKDKARTFRTCARARLADAGVVKSYMEELSSSES